VGLRSLLATLSRAETLSLRSFLLVLLELIEEHRSIAAAGRAMDMSYRRAWLLVDNLNHCFKEAVVEAKHGGRAGGGASLTEFGRSLVAHYRGMEDEAERATRKRLKTLQAGLRAG